MRLLKSSVHPDVKDIHVSSFTRKAARAIVLNGDHILLLYTQKYDDYSLPGGGIEKGEDIIAGLIRELEEETGAQNVTDIKEFGLYEEFRPWYKPDFDLVHMESYCFICNIDDVLLKPKFEAHEINNGMRPQWINIHEAISHNKQTIKHSDKKGMSIERETFLLELIVKELLQ
ncbi:NUDIX hydrolase [Psychrosphaera aquimarina]|uniref:NUDIX hydrolase n=1 Tax=Psychrosphaera aquimarina TaxID=2044854 RepID=A0ABU3QVT8_9GAMM|nr:NUDIX hydrolase [Psychrosphaera aquimarina]MDU0111520.1 NUDIX hydrolase [Psychrosphaera aquimarina]